MLLAGSHPRGPIVYVCIKEKAKDQKQCRVPSFSTLFFVLALLFLILRPRKAACLLQSFVGLVAPFPVGGKMGGDKAITLEEIRNENVDLVCDWLILCFFFLQYHA